MMYCISGKNTKLCQYDSKRDLEKDKVVCTNRDTRCQMCYLIAQCNWFCPFLYLLLDVTWTAVLLRRLPRSQCRQWRIVGTPQFVKSVTGVLPPSSLAQIYTPTISRLTALRAN